VAATHSEARQICKPWPIREVHGIQKMEPGSPCSREIDRATERSVAVSPTGARLLPHAALRCSRGRQDRTPPRLPAAHIQSPHAIAAVVTGDSDNIRKENHLPDVSPPVKPAQAAELPKAQLGAHAPCAGQSIPMARGFSHISPPRGGHMSQAMASRLANSFSRCARRGSFSIRSKRELKKPFTMRRRPASRLMPRACM